MAWSSGRSCRHVAAARHIREAFRVCQVFWVNDIKTTSLIANTMEADGPYIEHVVARDLITPGEIMRLLSEAMILNSTGHRPALAQKIRYHADPEFQTLFDPS